MEIIGLLLTAIFLIVAYFVGKEGTDKYTRRKYTGEIKYIFEQIELIEEALDSLYKQAKKKEKETIKEIRLKIEKDIRKVAQDLLFEVPKLTGENEYKNSSILYQLKSKIDNTYYDIGDLEEKIISREGY